MENTRRNKLKDKLFWEKEEKNQALQKNKIKNVKKIYVHRIDMFRSNKRQVKKTTNKDVVDLSEEEDKKYFE